MLKITLFGCLMAFAVASNHSPFKVVFEWKYIKYNWPSPSELEQAQNNGKYIEQNNAIAGIKLWKDKMYLAIPRWRSGVPVTLAVTSATPQESADKQQLVTDPALDPYPNWKMQTLGDCEAFQTVQSMEIDPLGRMWVLDTGRSNTMDANPDTKCPPRLVILDLENNGAVLRSYTFPNEVASKYSAYLNDIVLDHDDGGMAFIADNGRDAPGIIVYSMKNNTSWKVKHDSMKADPEAVSFKVASTPITKPVNIDGIALSPPGPNRIVYYSPLSSFHLFSIPVSVLKNSSVSDVGNDVTDLGVKQSQTDGMIMTNQGVLYLGLLADDAIAMWNLTKHSHLETGLRTITRDHYLTQWPDTFAINEGWLWCVTNGLQNFITNKVDITQPNYRVIQSNVTVKNYQYLHDGSAPELPVLERLIASASADRINLALSSCLTITLVFLAR